jgi:hypothetical protein
MNYRKSLIPALILGLSIGLLAGPASAWEFSMDGVYTWQYEYRSQQGARGFFGPFDLADRSGVAAGILDFPGAAAPYNFYLGGYHLGQVAAGTTTPTSRGAVWGGQGSSLAGGESIVSGSDANWNIMYMSTNMQVRMNQAVRIRGNYFIGSWNNPNYSTSQGLMVSSGMYDQDAPGVQRSFSPGYWRTLWLTAQLPWGEISVGKRPSSWGMGLQYDGADNRHSDSVALTVPYGPFRIQMSFYAARRGYGTDDYGSSNVYYNERPDKNNTRVMDMTIPNVQYNAGPISMGFLFNWIFKHRGGESVIGNPSPANYVAGTRGVQGRDNQDQYGAVFFKYNNGRFFLNTEWDWQRVTDLRTGHIRNTPMFVSNADQIPPLYIQHDSLAVEAGVLCGPSKISVIGAWFTGDDYRYSNTANGANQRVLVTAGKQSDTWSNTSVFRPYSYLMIYGYGLGTSFARDTGNGFVQDASVYAARLDYAVAANLNIYGSFTWAEKFSKSGDIWGCLVPNPAPVLQSGAVPNGSATAGSVLYVTANRGVDALVPTIPDTALGYEIDAGFDWKLLEGLTARGTFGYWVPGKWFSYACVDKSIENWATLPTSAPDYYWGVRPNRTIDPVFGMEFKLEGTF